MPQAQPQLMSQEERAAIALKAFELRDKGKLEECELMLKQIPLQPYLAKFVKDHIEYFGKDFFEKYGWNLSEAETEYGPNWFTK
jgi:hypothetical protein